MLRKIQRFAWLAMLTVAAALPAVADSEPQEALSVVVYDFEDPGERPAPTSVHEDVQAGLFMQPGFFPPPDRYFDGSIGGEPGEAIVNREYPESYDFTVEGLEAFDALDALSFTVTTRQRHTANGHHVSVTMFVGEDEKKQTMAFDVYDPDEDSDEPKEAGVESFFIGGHVGDSRRVVVDLSEVDHADGHSFRIRFDRSRMRSRTAVDDVELTAMPSER